jgi:hypothetical protein
MQNDDELYHVDERQAVRVAFHQPCRDRDRIHSVGREDKDPRTRPSSVWNWDGEDSGLSRFKFKLAASPARRANSLRVDEAALRLVRCSPKSSALPHSAMKYTCPMTLVTIVHHTGIRSDQDPCAPI